MDYHHIVVIGAGAWGTALAATMARAGRKVTLLARTVKDAEAIRRAGRNERYLPGVDLPETIAVTADGAALEGADAVLLVCPAQAQREVLRSYRQFVRDGLATVLCSKGFELGSGKLMSQVLAEEAPGLVPFVLSGPSFADDVVRGLPTAVTLAGPDLETARALGAAIGYRQFRIYASDDLKGTQIGGAVKNVLAIACGISDGMQLGDSCRAALITRAFSELMRLGSALGAKPQTLLGLSGFGDLALTCSSSKSRNYSLGHKLGSGADIAALTGGGAPLSEGVFTARVVVDIAARHHVELPICEAVNRVVTGASTPSKELQTLLERPMRAELD